jgi:hypothetical protein
MRHCITIFFILLLAYTLTFGGHLYSPDEEVMYRTTESLALRGSLAVEPLMGFATRKGIDGGEYAQYGIGQPLLSVPFYYLGDPVQSLMPDSQWIALHGRLRTSFPSTAPTEAPYVVASAIAHRLALSMFNIVITALAGAALFALALRLTSSMRGAWVGALAWGIGSQAWPHSRTYFSEPLAGLCLLLSLLWLVRYFMPRIDHRESISADDYIVAEPRPTGSIIYLILAGIAAGYGALVRIDSIVFLPGLTLIALWGDFESSPFSFRSFWEYPFQKAHRHAILLRLIAFATPIAAAGAIILTLNAIHFGNPLSSGYSDQPEGIAFSTPILAGLYGFLMSIGKGLFFFSPALILVFWGTRPMIRRIPVIASGIGLVFLAFLLFNSSWRNWAGGWCWGPRHIYQIHALLALPIAFWTAEKWTSARRITAISLIVIAAVIQVYGSSQSFIDFYRIYYQDPRPPNAHALYDPQTEPTLGLYAVFVRDANGKPSQEISPLDLPAPINDSIYVVQNSQWPRYAEMWRYGVHDLFWLHLMGYPARGAEVPYAGR